LEGVEKALAWRPDVAVVDIGLPRLNGYQVARRLRAALGGQIFLIAHTGYGQPQDRKQGLEAGFDLYCVKPINFEELCRWLAFAAGRATAGNHDHPAESLHGSTRPSSPAGPPRICFCSS
jgi:DNA-binding response OmpR family regulator